MIVAQLINAPSMFSFSEQPGGKEILRVKHTVIDESD